MAAGPGQRGWQPAPPASWPAPAGPQQWQPTQPPGPDGRPGAPGYGAPAPSYLPGGTAPFGPPPQRNRKPLFVTLGAGAAVLIVVAIVLVITLAGGNKSGGGGSAADTVKGYLEALARGDAEAALAYSDDQPASKDFLTNDILKKQLAQWPITNIRILSDDSTSSSALGMGQVHVAANFGDKVSDATLRLKRNNGRWYLESAAIKLQPSPGSGVNAADRTLTFFGKPVGDNTSYVFPGYVDIGSSDPYLKVKAKSLLLDSLTSYTPWVQADFSLNDAGGTAVNDALASAFAACQNSTALKPPPPCPLEGLDPVDFVEGTAHWGRADLSQVKVQGFDPYHLSVSFYGQVTVPVSVQSTSGRTRDGTITPFLNGTADIAKVPPALSYR